MTYTTDIKIVLNLLILRPSSGTINIMPANISRTRFRRLLFIAIVVPLVIMLSIAGLLAWQVSQLLAASTLVQHNDKVIAQANELQKLNLNMETGLRGYLITGNTEFLKPYNDAIKVIDGETAELLTLVSDEPVQIKRLNQIQKARVLWREYAEAEIAIRKANGDYTSMAQARAGKVQMDAIRLMYHQFIDVEYLRRDVRSHNARRESRITLWLMAAVGLLGGGGLALLSRRQFLEISATYAEALKTANDLNVQLEARVQERTAALMQRTDELRDANRELEAFGYSVSHDLRAPMRHISGFADLMRTSVKNKLNADEMELLTTIFDTARLAGRMVDDLLSFSRIGRAKLKLQPVDLNEMVARCKRELFPDTLGREIQWVVHNLPTVSADSGLMKMAMQNLLGNAVKYTGRAEYARIELGALDPDVSGGPLDFVASADAAEPPVVLPNGRMSHVLFIRDNGVGFDMAFAGKLFGVFQRLHRAEDFEGTGIGLANVRRIISKHGGKVWAEGALGQGATFYFTLPIEAVSGEDYEPSQANPVG